MKIAFHSMVSTGWTVGEIYLKNIFYALRHTYGKKLGLYLLVPPDHRDVQKYVGYFQADDVIYYNLHRRWTPFWTFGKIAMFLSLRDISVETVLKKHKINIVFGLGIQYRYSKIATLSWIPDFQHIHLPKMFSDAERFSRDRAFLQCAKLSTRVIVMSESVKKDFEYFSPRYAHKVRILRPTSYIPQSIYNYDLKSILNIYNLPKKFIYLPNQFWKHKNHETVFKAIKILKDKGIKISVICTGNASDYRHPSYFTDLWQKLSQWNIRDQIIYLGLIPHDHVLLLMRQSICVLNPSLFEGCGITVVEARSVGKQVLLSNIPTHREQNPPGATFFNPEDSEDLAEKLANTWQATQPGPDYMLEKKAISSNPEQMKLYASEFMSILCEISYTKL